MHICVTKHRKKKVTIKIQNPKEIQAFENCSSIYESNPNPKKTIQNP